VSDGLGSFLGPIARAGQNFGPNVAQTITLTAYVVAIGTLLIIPKWPPGKHAAWLRRMIVLIGIPVLLSTDNFLLRKHFLPSGTLGIVAAMTAISSYVMSFLGLAVGNAMRMHVGRFGLACACFRGFVRDRPGHRLIHNWLSRLPCEKQITVAGICDEESCWFRPFMKNVVLRRRLNDSFFRTRCQHDESNKPVPTMPRGRVQITKSPF